jgi:hypothetical protein
MGKWFATYWTRPGSYRRYHSVTSQTTGEEIASVITREDYALLMAAAPDMLDLLKDIAYGDGSDYRLHPSLSKRLEEVIKKATE